MDLCYGFRSGMKRSRGLGSVVDLVASTTHPGTISTVFSMSRQCSRTGCAAPAHATLTYQYGRSIVWLDDLAPDRDPHSYDLCARHAARLSVPNGWRLEDRRADDRQVGAGNGQHRLAG
jgi:hypothetical protein